MRVRLCDALEVDGSNAWLVGWNLLHEPHRSAAYPQDRQHNAGPLPPVDAKEPPHRGHISTLDRGRLPRCCPEHFLSQWAMRRLPQKAVATRRRAPLQRAGSPSSFGRGAIHPRPPRAMGDVKRFSRLGASAELPGVSGRDPRGRQKRPASPTF